MAIRWERALVTGASSGIGRAFARALAARGTHLILVARRRERLEELAGELRRAHGVEVEVIAADLLHPSDLARVEERLRDPSRPPDLLVNNAGIGNAGPFWRLPLEGEEATVGLNVTALLRLTRAALPGMVERGWGGVLNVSSLAGLLPQPHASTYAATKAFVTVFTESLAEELRGTGVRVLALCPGYTRTEFHQRKDFAHLQQEEQHPGGSGLPAFLWASPDRVAEEGLRALERGKVVHIPGSLYRTTYALARLLPRAMVRAASGGVMRLSARRPLARG